MVELFDVVGVGINSVDRLLVLPAFPAASGPRAKMRVRRAETVCGGQTATTMAACARWGLRARYVGAVGNDANGRLVRDGLSACRVDVSNLVVHDAVTRFAEILIDERTGERSVLWDFDRRLELRDDELPAAVLRSARLVHVDDVDERAALRAAAVARASGVPVTSDIDRITTRTRELIDAVTVAIFAEDVPLHLAGGVETRAVGETVQPRADRRASLDDLRDALATIPRRPEQTLCVTLGERGALALDEHGFHHQPAFTVASVDTTGAGDVFRAGLIFARLQGWGLDEQLRWGSAAAAAACTRLGAITSVPSRADVETLLS